MKSGVLKNCAALLAIGLMVAACSDEPATTAPETETPDPKAALMALADSYLDERLKYSPGVAYFVDLPLAHHDGLNDISAEAMARWQAYEDRQLTELEKIDADALAGTPEWILLGQMREMLEASIGLRVCRRELWSVNHMGGFYNGLGRLAGRQPVGTPELRADALARFAKVAGYVEDDIANLRRGVELGYLSPKNAVGRVIKQVDGLIGLPLDKSPLLAPARADDDEAFGEEFTALIRDEVLPAFKAYRDFLENEYLDQARTTKGVGANPDGRECFIASYRSYTTLKRTPEEVFELGQATVDGYRARVVEVGQRLYGITDFSEILKRVANDPANRFTSGDEVEAAYNAVVAKAEAAMAGAFPKPPEAKLEVQPYPPFLAGTGMSARYESATRDRPGVFRFDPSIWKEETRGGAEIVSVHEGYPGHHLQISIAREARPLHPVSKLAFNSAYVEGWARYAEALAEELGIYSTDAALIERRSWPARGMITDPALHVLGWSDEEVKAVLIESGRFDKVTAERALDRISVLPAQLTSYDSGALELFALRKMAEEALGEEFDLKTFHGKVLEDGILPLWMLRQKIESWLEGEAG